MALAFNSEAPLQRSEHPVFSEFVALIHPKRMLTMIFLYVNLPPANDCRLNLFNSSLIPINLQRNSLSAQNYSCFDFYKSLCNINKCLPDDFARTNLFENNVCHPPNIPAELTCSCWGLSTCLQSLCSFKDKEHYFYISSTASTLI